MRTRLGPDAAWRALAFDTVLDAVSSAAFVLDEHGTVHHANRVGRAWLTEDAATRAADLRAAVAANTELAAAFRVTRIPREPASEGALFLAVLESPAEASADSTVMPVAPIAPGANRADPNPAGLTARERDVLDLLAHGATYDEIANMLGIATNTVRSHVRSLYEKLGASSKTEALREGVRLGYVSLPACLRDAG